MLMGVRMVMWCVEVWVENEFEIGFELWVGR